MAYNKEVVTSYRYCPGVAPAEGWMEPQRRLTENMAEWENWNKYWKSMDRAWTVCLLKAGIINKETAKKVLESTMKLTDSDRVSEWGLMAVGLDEDTASVVNIGRTMQEPMSRLQLREVLNKTIDDVHGLLQSVIEVAERNIDAIMPGHTHLSQAQPITLAHYLLSVFDALQRGQDALELAYRDTNRNSGGCGACSGIIWPVDRRLMTELLGFDELLEPTYDSEASQDHSMSILFAIANIGLLISKSSIDMNIWGMEEIDMLRTPNEWTGCSSMMPQKSIPGSQFERARIESSFIIGETNTGISLSKGEPHADMLPICQVWGAAIRGMFHAQAAIGFYKGMLENVQPQKEKMLKYVREGYSCTTEIVVHMIKELGYGGRRSHRIVGTFARMGREQNLKAFETTGELLDEAAEFAGEKPPKIDTATLRKLLNPEEFIKNHNNIGGTAPEEAQRMIKIRKNTLSSMSERHKARKERIKQGEELLEKEIGNILN